MNAVKERLLELALEEVVGGHTPPDLEARILLAAAAPPAGRRFSLGPALAAAAVLLVAAGVWWASTRDHTAPLPPPPLLTAAEQEQVDGWVAELRKSQTRIDMSKPEGGRQAIAILNASRDLRHFMERRPDAFPAVRERLQPFPGSSAPMDVLDHFMEVLARGPDPAADPAVLLLLDQAPQKLSTDVLIALAEKRVVPARELLAVMFEAGSVRPGLALPAAYFAFRGDPIGEGELRAAVARPPMPGMLCGDYLAAAAGLHRLGDPGPWRDAVALARTRLLQAEQAGRAVMMADFIVNLVYLNETVATGRPVSLSNLFIRMKEYWVEHRSEFTTGPQLQQQLDRLAK